MRNDVPAIMVQYDTIKTLWAFQSSHSAMKKYGTKSPQNYCKDEKMRFINIPGL